MGRSARFSHLASVLRLERKHRVSPAIDKDFGFRPSYNLIDIETGFNVSYMTLYLVILCYAAATI